MISHGAKDVSLFTLPKKIVTTTGHHLVLYYPLKPDWFAAQVPKQATPVDIQGNTIVRIHGHIPQVWSTIPTPPTTFPLWRDQVIDASLKIISPTFTSSP